jgi:formylglycine-generating enzyme required for sulfatase activity
VMVKEGEFHRELQRIFADRKEWDPERAAHRFLTDVREHTSLLVDKGGRQYSFIHLTFQEYLTAAALAQRGQQEVEPIVEALSLHVGEATWREVSLLTLGYLGLVQQRDEAAGAVLGELVQRSPGPAGEAAILAGEALLDMGHGIITSEFRVRIVEALLQTIRDDQKVKRSRRTAAGAILAKIGDPRPEVMTVDGMEFCWLPAGPFAMGSKREDKNAFSNEKPQFEYSLPYDLGVGRYPVTAAQYCEYAAEMKQEQEWGRDQLSNEPVVKVSWYEALEFCHWLTARWLKSGRIKTGWEVRLPSNAEWEKAARGIEGLIFPWGEDADLNRANFSNTGFGERSAVGCFPGGASPWGCEELSGNVWEWTSSLSLDYPYDPAAGMKGRTTPEDYRELRGGAFYSAAWGARCAYRGREAAGSRAYYLGFRVVLTPSPL